MPLAGLAALALAALPTAPVRVDGALVHPRRVWVRLSDPGAVAEVAGTGLRVVATYPQIGWAVVETPVGALRDARRRLAGLPGVTATAYDRAAKPAYEPNDPDWPKQWHLNAIHVDKAWDVTRGSNSAVVAILDTGVDVGHEDLRLNVWRNSREIANNGVDDDGNGYVDDVNGYDFAYGDGNPDDVNGHGTACAGIAAALGDNGKFISGIAPRARVMALKSGLDSGYFYDSATVPSYLYAADNGARVLSMSYYSDRVSPAERDGLRYCVSKGLLPIAAAGNDATVIPYYPAAYPEVLAVAATNRAGTKAGFSNWGSWVDVAAPGTELITLSSGGGTRGFGGTSGACPHVAGVAALLFGSRAASNPATAAQVRAAIEDTATAVDQAPFGEYANYGFVNARAALDDLAGGTPPGRARLARWVSPYGAGAGTVEVAGRGLATGTVNAGSSAGRMAVVSRGRDSLRLTNVATSTAFSLTVGGERLGYFSAPERSGLVWPLTEASANGGAAVTGGFAEAQRPDVRVVNVTKRVNKTFEVVMVFRNLPRDGSRSLRLRRRYTVPSLGSKERVAIYDWSSASYPYGNWTELSSRACRDTWMDSRTTIPDFGRYVDDEGAVYVRIQTDAVEVNARLEVDAAYLR